MIYTMTCNPSLDYLMSIDHFQEGETNRSSKELIFPGGKGFNVSTILARLQMPSVALGFVAGFSGKEIIRLLKSRNFLCDLCELPEGFSRINVKMKGTKETEINGNGPCITPNDLHCLKQKLGQLQDGDCLVLAGSIPSSLPDNFYEMIMKQLQGKQIRIVVDATKDLLKKVLKYHPFLIKPNLRELEELFQKELHKKEEILACGKELQKAGAQNVLISMGKDGAILLCEDGHSYYCASAQGTLINSVGSGDSMVAGFLAGYFTTNDFQIALQLGSACGGATAFSQDLAQADFIKQIYEQLKTEKLV